MCGICGTLNLTKEHTVDVERLQRMIVMLRHRGPDAFGVYRDGSVGLAHARLSIIDLAGGNQPIANEDKTVWITYNGEVFNYLELREGLLKKGHSFSTRTDTEVIVHLYEEKKEDLFRSLNGQFAFALWDKTQRQLLLARDRLGIRPLYYALADGALLFASEIKALLADPRVTAELDPVGLDQFFTFWATLPPRTVFKNIYELPPGHYLRARRGTLTIARYWDLPFPDALGGGEAPRSEQRYAEDLLGLLTDATRLRLRADVPVASYLSGGIDSSFISALVKKYFNDRLQTFSVGFSDHAYDESGFQNEMAAFLGTEHRQIHCTDADIGRVMPEVVWHSEKPLVRTAPAPLYLLSGLVREHGIKVVLTGEGADEILAGYDLFREARIRRFWARQPESKWRSALLRDIYQYIPHWPKRAPAYLEAFYRSSLTATGASYYSHIPRWETTAKTKLFFSGDLKAALEGYRSVDAFEETLPADFFRWDHLSQAQYIETVTLLSGNLLSSQGDRMMMAHSVEGRLPFLDYRVVEFCCRLPPRLRLRSLEEKYLLKEIARPFLPASIVGRRKQAYRAPDSASFFHGASPDYVETLLSRENLEHTGYFDAAAVERLVRKCKTTRGPLIGTRDNIAVVGIITTLLLDHHFVQRFSERANHLYARAKTARDAASPDEGEKNENVFEMRIA